MFIVGHVTKWIFFRANFQIYFRIKFIFGNPEIRRINLVLKLKKINNINGKDVIKCIIKYFGSSFFIRFLSGKNDIKKILGENLLRVWGEIENGAE